MKRLSVVLLCLLVWTPLFAEESILSLRFFSEFTEDSLSTESTSGIWRFDPTTSSYSFVRPMRVGWGLEGAGLAVTDHRIIVESTHFTEFDPENYRFLRRYKAFPAESGRWVFRGSLITAADGERFGIKPGYYGFIYCPYEPSSVLDCGPIQRPVGYDRPEYSGGRTDILLRRPLDPADASLELVHRFPEGGTRHVSFDPARGGFWVRYLGGKAFPTYEQELSFLSIRNDTWFENSVVKQDGDLRSPDLRFAGAFLYSNERFITTFDYYNSNRLGLVEQSIDWTNERELISGPLYSLPSFMSATQSESAEQTELVVPAIGKAPGANGTNWQSDLWFFNPDAGAVTVRMSRVSRPERSISVTLPPHGSHRIGDVLGAMGGGAAASGGDGVGTDALLVTVPERSAKVSVYSRTYTSDGVGTYGQAVPAVPTRNGYSNHSLAFEVDASVPFEDHIESAIVLDRREPGRFRHNLGAVNSNDAPLTLQLRLGGEQKSIVVAPHSVANVNLETLFSPDAVASRLPYAWVIGDRPAPLWLSMVDNRTGDATFVPFTIFPMRGDARTPLRIPAVASTVGANGTYWKTDLYGYFPREDLTKGDFQNPNARLAAEGCSPTKLKGPSDKYSMIFPDVVGQFRCGDRRAALLMNIGAWTSGYSRTYTTREDGGSYGDMLPFYPIRGWKEQHFSGLDQNENFRVNIGLHNGNAARTAYWTLLYDVGGALVSSREWTLEPDAEMQVPLSSLDLPSGLYGLSVVPADGTSRVWSYVSIVDNRTGDPTNLW